MQPLLNIGFSNYVLANRLAAILNPQSSPMRRLREDAKNEGRLVDATQGRKTRSILVLDSNHVVLCAVSPETIAMRFESAAMQESRTEAAEAEDSGENGEASEIRSNGTAEEKNTEKKNHE